MSKSAHHLFDLRNMFCEEVDVDQAAPSIMPSQACSGSDSFIVKTLVSSLQDASRALCKQMQHCISLTKHSSSIQHRLQGESWGYQQDLLRRGVFCLLARLDSSNHNGQGWAASCPVSLCDLTGSAIGLYLGQPVTAWARALIKSNHYADQPRITKVRE
jgi:hypothetical protein